MPKQEGVLTQKNMTNVFFEISRLNSPVHSIAKEGWDKVSQYEKGTEIEKGIVITKKRSAGDHVLESIIISRDECIRALYCALVTDETAIKLLVPKDSPYFSSGYPRVVAALRETVAEKLSHPQLAAYALYSLAFFAQFDPSLGDSIEMMNRILSNPEICSYISKPAALVCRSSARNIRVPSHRSSQEEAHRGTFMNHYTEKYMKYYGIYDGVFQILWKPTDWQKRMETTALLAFCKSP